MSDTTAPEKSSVDQGGDIDERMPVLSPESVKKPCNLYDSLGYFALDLAPVSKPTAPTIKSHVDGTDKAVIVEIHDISSLY